MRNDDITRHVSLWNLRLRAVLGRQYATLVAVLVVLALVGGVATYTAHVDPGTTTEERVVATWESSASFDHGARVTRENPLFPVGSELRNRAVYFTPISPGANGTYTFGYRATGDGEVATTVDVALVTRSIVDGAGSDNGGQATVVWERTRTLRETEATGLDPGASVRVPFSFNASAVRAERERIEAQLGGGSGDVETFVRTTVTLEGRVNGQTVDTRQVHTLPVTLGRSTYRLGPADASSQQFETTRPITMPREYGPLRSVGGPLLLLLSFGSLVGLVVGRHRTRLELTEAEREWLAYRENRAEFDEWITTFLLPTEAFDRPEAEASSLADLVDFAIDTDNGVVESPDGTEYYVLHDGFLYLYTAPSRPGLDREAATPVVANEGSEPTTDPETTTDSNGELAAQSASESEMTSFDPGPRPSAEGPADPTDWARGESTDRRTDEN